MRALVVVPLLASAVAFSSGCGDKCGTGTTGVNGVCQAACGPGAKLVEGRCTADCAPGTVLSEAAHGCVTEADAFDAEPTPWSKNVKVSPVGKWSAEPSVAIDSHGRIFVASMVEPDTSRAEVATLFESDDGGQSFATILSVPSKHPGGFSGDVSVAVDSTDAVYFSHIDYGVSSTQQYPPSDVWVHVSYDHGATFHDVKINQDAGNYFTDRPWLVVGPADELMLSFTYESETQLSQGYPGGLPVMHSTDHGATWSALGDIAATLAAQSIYTDGQFPTARTKSTYLIPRITYANLMSGAPDLNLDVYRTTDFRSFHPTHVDKIFSDRDLSVDTMAVPAVGPDGAVYLTYLNASSRNIDLSFAKSTDDGQTFSTPVSVHAVDQSATQAMPWMAIDPKSGAVNLLFIDNHTGEWMVVGARSTDGGQTFDLSRVSDQTFVEDSTQTKWMGDFNAIAVGGGKLCAVWTDTRDGESGIYLSCRGS